MFINLLKTEMFNNPIKAVASLLVLINMEQGQQYDVHHPEKYRYETKGSNHSRIALQVFYILLQIHLIQVEC